MAESDADGSDDDDVGSSSILHSLSIAEFDITVGNTLSIQYPVKPFEPHGCMSSKEATANLCLPDGAHLFEDGVP